MTENEGNIENAPSSLLQDSPHVQKKGILLINTGTPDSPKPEDIRTYLAEFLSDRNLIDVPPFIWNIILNAFILRKRPKITSGRYQSIWTPEGSPFMVHSLSLRDKLQNYLDQHATNTCFVVEFGARYGNPSIEKAFSRFAEAGCTSVTSIPLFPQTAFSTTKTCLEKARSVARTYPNISHQCIKGYSDEPLYIEAIKNIILRSWNYEPGSKLLFTFHSVPLKHINRGDSYVAEIEQSMNTFAQSLNIPRQDWEITFHSRFEDSRKWVGPNIYTVLQVLAQKKVNRVAIIAPGFSADCLETLYDCDVVQRKFFDKACQDEGIESDFTYIPSLNDDDIFVELLATIAAGI